MIDIGVNLTNSRFNSDLEDVLLRAKQAGVEQFVVTGTNIKESLAALALCEQYSDTLVCTAGIHPHDADNVESDYLSQLSTFAQYDAVKAIGECGLDFNRNFSKPEQQLKVFEAQVELAAQLNLPLFLHQRDAFEQWFEILTPYLSKVPAMVSHCFTGNVEQMKQCVDAGMYIGITGWVCDERRGAELQQAVQHLPLERLLLETDAPYLLPRTIRPKPKSSRNEPSFLPYVATKVAELMGLPVETIIEQSEINSKKVFSL